VRLCEKRTSRKVRDNVQDADVKPVEAGTKQMKEEWEENFCDTRTNRFVIITQDTLFTLRRSFGSS
jgi:hypothetical protein